MWSLIDDLDNLMQRALRVPASGKVLIDEDAVYDILDQMREVAPDEVRLGQRIAAERERILADARAQASRLMEEATVQVKSHLDEQAVVQAARERAGQLEETARKQAASLQADADRYVAGQLNALEQRLQRVLRETQAGRRALRVSSEERSQKTDDRS